MKSNKIFSLTVFPVLLLIAILNTGCPYQSSYPVDSPNVKVDIALLGRWEDATGSTSFSSEKPVYVVTKKSDYVYAIETTSYDLNSETNEYEKNVTYYEGHVSLINDTKFLNVKQISSEIEGDSYYIYKMEVAGNNCILSEVSSCIEKKFSSSSELKAFLLKNIDNELLFSGSATFFRN